MLVAALKSRYFRHRCYRCFLHSVSSVTINEVTDQSAAVVDVVVATTLSRLSATESAATDLPIRYRSFSIFTFDFSTLWRTLGKYR